MWLYSSHNWLVIFLCVCVMVYGYQITKATSEKHSVILKRQPVAVKHIELDTRYIDFIFDNEDILQTSPKIHKKLLILIEELLQLQIETDPEITNNQNRQLVSVANGIKNELVNTFNGLYFCCDAHDKIDNSIRKLRELATSTLNVIERNTIGEGMRTMREDRRLPTGYKKVSKFYFYRE